MTYRTSEVPQTGSPSAKKIQKGMIHHYQLVGEVSGRAREPVHLYLSIRAVKISKQIRYITVSRARMLDRACCLRVVRGRTHLEEGRREVAGGQAQWSRRWDRALSRNRPNLPESGVAAWPNNAGSQRGTYSRFHPTQGHAAKPSSRRFGLSVALVGGSRGRKISTAGRERNK